MDIFKEPVVYVDIETSGGNINTSKITEVAAIRVEGGEIIREFRSLVNPGAPLPYWITQLTGISDEDVADAPYFDEIADELNEVLSGAIFIAHNVRFDYGYIKRQLEACGHKFNPKLLCTVRLSRALYKDAQGHSLEKIIKRHGIEVNGRHRAYADAKAIMDFTNLAYSEHGTELFLRAIAQQFKTRSHPSKLEEGQIELLKNSPGVYIFEDESGRPLYVGKSVKVKSRVMSHFNSDLKIDKERKIVSTTSKVRSIETNNELEALLLESKLVKELLPIHNRRLRRRSNNYLVMKSIDSNGYTNLNVVDKDLSEVEDISTIYGIYTSKAKAKASLEDRRKTFDLCPKLLGLEKGSGPCFQYQLKHCKGACINKENEKLYNLRVDLASQRTKIENWRYDSPVVISTEDGTNLVVDKWVVLGFIDKHDQSFNEVEKRFDLDTYRILISFIKRNLSSISIKPYSPQVL